MNNSDVARKEEKFLFNVHVFDVPEEDELEIPEEDLPPPPPVFSLEELEAAKAQAYKDGFAAAEAEAKASRAQALANIFDTISRDMKKLFDNEDLREESYEFEAVILAERIFKHVFPLYAEVAGFDELKATMRKIIQEHNGEGRIRVAVHPDMLEGTQSFLVMLSETNPDLRFDVKGDETIGLGGCKLGWEHGGAIRNSEAMALQIRQILQESLAARGAKGHDSEDGHHEPETNTHSRTDKGDTP